MIRIGAIGFFQTLRPYAPEDIHTAVDFVIERLSTIRREQEDKVEERIIQEEKVVEEIELHQSRFKKYSSQVLNVSPKIGSTPKPEKIMVNKQLHECDTQYLFEINIRLQQRKSEIIQESLEELLKSPLVEFPIETFVQNTDILKVGLRLICNFDNTLSHYYYYCNTITPCALTN